MAKEQKLILLLTALFALIFFLRCASQLPPDGGEIDKIPPKIIEVVPENGTINYRYNFFEITFSEYVDKRSVQDAIFVSPSVQNGFEFDWSGRTLRVYFKDPLKANTTYTVTIGAKAEDLNNRNKMNESFTFAFSTGNKIDKGKISGKVYTHNSDGVMVFAYVKNENEIDPSAQKPDYLSQVGTNGKYTLLGLREGEYKIFAIRDKLNNLLYDLNDDDFGVQFKKVVLNEPFIEFDNVDFFLTSEDTIAPTISNVFMKDEYHLQIEFNERVDSSKISSKNFYAIDTVANKKIHSKYFFKGDAKPNQFYLAFSEKFDKNGQWDLIAEMIPDLYENASAIQRSPFLVGDKPDTNAAAVLKIVGTLSDEKFDYENSKLIVKLSDGVDSLKASAAISVHDSKGNKYISKIKFINDAECIVDIQTKLKPSSEYILMIDLKGLEDAVGNKIDSLYKFKFTTVGELDFSGASGSVKSNDGTDLVVLLKNVEQNKISYQQKVDSKNNFDFKKIVPGKYLLWSFKDNGKNGKYDHGTIKPFNFAEEFKFYPDTLNLRARWPVVDISLSFDKN